MNGVPQAVLKQSSKNKFGEKKGLLLYMYLITDAVLSGSTFGSDQEEKERA